MHREFTEAVFEGHYNTIRGYIEGLVAATGEDLRFYFSSDSGVEGETLSEHIKEWISLGGKLHHVLLEKELFDRIVAALAASGAGLLNSSSIKSSKPVKGLSFRFRFAAYGRKYAEEIKGLLERLPEDVSLTGYEPVEKVDRDAEGVELYAPTHDYEFKGEGVISGPVGLIIPLRSELDAHPLIEADKATLLA